MDITFLFIGSAKKIVEIILTKVISAGSSTAWDAIRDYLTEDPERKQLYLFLEKVNDCLYEAAREAKIELPVPADQKWRITWLRSFFDWRDGSIEPTRYLPNFGPVEKLRKVLEEDLIQNGRSEQECERFIYRFNLQVTKIPQDEQLQKVFQHFLDGSFNFALRKHLQYTSRLEKFSMNPGAPSLSDTYIEAKGVLATADAWESFIRPGGYTRPAKDLIEDYFSAVDKELELPERSCIFVGADFGLGKTSFARMTASSMAKRFLIRMDGFIPFFFPLVQYTLQQVRHYLQGVGVLSTDGPRICLFLDGLDESGPVEESHMTRIIEYVDDLQQCIPRGSRLIITSRLIFGSTGYLAGYIRKRLGNSYIKICGFDAQQIKEFFARLAKIKDFRRAGAFNLEKLREIGLKDDECSKPLYLWMVSVLIKEGLLDLYKPSLPLERTGLYLLFLNWISREAKPKDTDARVLAIPKEIDDEQEIRARYLLERLASISNLLSPKKGLSNAILSKCMDTYTHQIFQQMGEYRFISLSYFGHNGEYFDFTHQTFKDFLIAEYVLTVFLKATANNNILAERERLCIGTISDDAAEFLGELTEGLVKSNRDHTLSDLMRPILKSAAKDCPKLAEQFQKQSFSLDRSFILSLIRTAEILMENEDSVFLGGFEECIECKIHFGHPAMLMNKKHVELPFQQERWLALLIASRALKSLGMGAFLEKRQKGNSSVIIKLLQSSFTIPVWGKKELDGVSMHGARLVGLDLSKASFEKALLNYATLDRANLQGAVLVGAELIGASLIGANLRDAVLINANLDGADCRGADFSGSKLAGARLKEADLSRADFSQADMSSADLTGAKLHCSNLSDANIRTAVFEGVDLCFVNLTGTTLPDSYCPD